LRTRRRCTMGDGCGLPNGKGEPTLFIEGGFCFCGIIRVVQIGVSLIYKLRLLILAGVLLFSGCKENTEETEKLKKYENDFISYLQTKYERSFEIEKIGTSKYLGGTTTFNAEVYPSSQKKLGFSISVVEGEEGQYSENYLATKWSKEADKLMKQQMKEIFGDEVNYKFMFSVKKDILEKEIISEKEQSFSYALSEFNDQLFPAVHIVDIEADINLDEKFLELYELTSFLKKNNLQNTTISLETYSIDYKGKIEKNPKKFLELGFTDRVRYKQDNVITFSVLLKDSDTVSVTSEEDIARIYYNN
jgi:hypothetical protein